MKKFDIRKWLKDQKNLPKDKRALNSSPEEKAKIKKLNCLNLLKMELMFGENGLKIT